MRKTDLGAVVQIKALLAVGFDVGGQTHDVEIRARYAPADPNQAA